MKRMGEISAAPGGLGRREPQICARLRLGSGFPKGDEQAFDFRPLRRVSRQTTE
jgi:hypothetical protein